MIDPWMTSGYVVGPLRKTHSLENPINMAVLGEVLKGVFIHAPLDINIIYKH